MDSVIEAVKLTAVPFEILEIDPSFSDTAAFCEKYGHGPEMTANTILVVGKTEPRKYCACVVLATTKLDVNRAVKALMNCKVSFASAEEMTALTGMEVGAVTPFGLPPGIPIYVDENVLKPQRIVVGAGKRHLKILISPEALLRLQAAEKIAGLAQPKAP